MAKIKLAPLKKPEETKSSGWPEQIHGGFTATFWAKRKSVLSKGD